MKRSVLFVVFAFLISLSGRITAQSGAATQKKPEYDLTRRVLQAKEARRARFALNTSLSGAAATANFKQIYYKLDFFIQVNPDNLTATATGTFRSEVDGLSAIQLDFDSRDGIAPWAGLAVSGNASGFTLSNDVLTVNLDRVYNSGEIFTVSVQYAGIPRSSGLKGFGFDTNNYGDISISTLSEPYAAHTWWPCLDDPSEKFDSLSVRVVVPEGLTVASNGLLYQDAANGDGTHTFLWKSHYPMTAYLVSLAISSYAHFSDSVLLSSGVTLPIEYFVYPAQRAAAAAAFAPIPEMITIYSRLYGIYPFQNEKYGQAVFQWGGAMEHQTITSIGQVSTNWRYIYAHELSHHWFGDKVTCATWGDIWLNEGFARYSEALYEEQINGFAAYQAYLRAGLPGREGWGSEPVFRYDISDPSLIFRWTVYEKGAWVLHMLRGVLGDSVFFSIIHDYPNDPRFAYLTTTTEQFKNYCEQKSGRNLDWFFNEWIYKPYFPVYLWDYRTVDDNGAVKLKIKIQQAQDTVSPAYTHLYKMPIPLRVTFTDSSRADFTLRDSLRSQSFTLNITGSVANVHLDPEDWILKTAQQTALSITEPAAIPGGFVLEQNYPNPFNPGTTIRYRLFRASRVRLTIINNLGQVVRRLLDAKQTTGTHLVKWDGRNDAGREVASGIYYYRLRTDSGVRARKMLLLR